MSVKFRKRIRVFPGLTLNLSKSGMSATIGVKGFSTNIGPNGTYLNLGIPGTGIYDRIKLDGSQIIDNQDQKDTLSIEVIEERYEPQISTSDSMQVLRQSILDAKQTKEELYNEWKEAEREKKKSYIILIISRIFIIGFIIKTFHKNYKERNAFSNELHKEYENFKLEIKCEFDPHTKELYEKLMFLFSDMSRSQKIVDIVSSEVIDKYKERSIADNSLTTENVSFYTSYLDFLKTDYPAMVFGNAVGGDLYFFPSFIIIKRKDYSDIAIIDLKTIDFSYCITQFHETNRVPIDSEVLGYTWRYTNKNGGPDKRFNDNYQIPIMKYQKLSFSSVEGLNKNYIISNQKVAKNFCDYLSTYLNFLKNLNWSSSRAEITNDFETEFETFRKEAILFVEEINNRTVSCREECEEILIDLKKMQQRAKTIRSLLIKNGISENTFAGVEKVFEDLRIQAEKAIIQLPLRKDKKQSEEIIVTHADDLSGYNPLDYKTWFLAGPNIFFFNGRTIDKSEKNDYFKEFEIADLISIWMAEPQNQKLSINEKYSVISKKLTEMQNK